jgi:hypothetical protein
MLPSILGDVVTLPLDFALRATKAVAKSEPFASILDTAVNVYRDAAAGTGNIQLNTLESLFGISTPSASSLAHLRNFIRDAAKQQLSVGAQFDAAAFQEELAVEMRQMGFDDATIEQVGTSLTGIFAEMRGLSPALKHDLLELLDGSQTDETVTPAAGAGLMQ